MLNCLKTRQTYKYVSCVSRCSVYDIKFKYILKISNRVCLCNTLFEIKIDLVQWTSSFPWSKYYACNVIMYVLFQTYAFAGN